MAASLKDFKILASFKERLEQLSCPFTENVDDSWIMELIFTPGEPRIRLLQWLFAKIDPKLGDLLDPQNAPANTKMDSRIQRLLFVSSNLGLCNPEDADLVRGVTTGSRQSIFMNSLIDIVCAIDSTENIYSWSLGKSSSINTSLVDQFSMDGTLMDALASRYRTENFYTSDVKLLPPDIVKQIEIEKSAERTNEKDKQSSVHSDLTQLLEEADKLLKDIQRQTEILQAIKKLSREAPVRDASLKVTMKQTIKLVLSELDQLITNFLCCFDNEMKHWCNKSPPKLNDLGVCFKRVHGLLSQFLTLLLAIQSTRTSHQKICVDLRRDVSRIRSDVSRINEKHSRQKANPSNLLQTLKESVDELEQSIVRIESQSWNISTTSSAIVRLD